jgi:23S rRNA pseudouridine2605 synthase
VTLNGAIRRDPETPVHIERHQIKVDHLAIKAAKNTYLIMNKPRGLVTTASDEKGRDTIYSLFADRGESLPWLAPVGRLDKASEGLLLLTNDSEWGARITAPETHLPKTYHVQITSIAGKEVLESLERGVKRTAGLRSHWMKARTATFAACLPRSISKSSGCCGCRSGLCSWGRFAKAPTGH